MSELPFTGFPGVGLPSYTPIPNSFFDVLAPNLSEAELRVLISVMRRTFGFGQSSDDLSLEQLVEGSVSRDGHIIEGGTGLNRHGVTEGVRGLVEKNVLIAHRSTAPDGGDRPTTYSLRFDIPGDRVSTRVRAPQRNVGTTQEVAAADSKDDPELENLIEDVTYELHDSEHYPSNLTRARRLYESSGLLLDEFLEQVIEAQKRARRARNIRYQGDQAFTKNRMPYFFAVLEDLLKSG